MIFALFPWPVDIPRLCYN